MVAKTFIMFLCTSICRSGRSDIFKMFSNAFVFICYDVVSTLLQGCCDVDAMCIVLVNKYATVQLIL